MNIVILAGGTGSIALQQGLHSLINTIEGVDVKIIVNAYDNGLSTGAVRRVMAGNILGPSDVRKNQTTIYKLKGSEKAVMDFLDHRFTCKPSEAEAYCLDQIHKLQDAASPRIDRRIDILQGAVAKYFSFSAASQIDYDDFSLANIIYAGLAAQYGNSMRKAATVMAEFLGIPDNVLVNDDASLFLGAITKRGKKLTDEGDIVSWNTPGDPIIDVFFVDAQGNTDLPVLNDESKRALTDADLIIMSSGTQWSSLIPTYMSMGFKDAIAQTNAKVLMVMNRVPDKDAPDQSASDIIRSIVPRFFPKNKIELIIDSAGDEIMSSVDSTAAKLLKSTNSFDLTALDSKAKHHPIKLAYAIIRTVYKEYMDAAAYVFDYDDTLVGRGNSFAKASQSNLFRIVNETKRKFMICSGNGIKAIKLPASDPWFSGNKEILPFTVFADGGINEYSYDPFSTSDEDERRFHFVKCLDEAARFDRIGPESIDSIVTTLCAAGIPTAKIENRGDVMITIKPIDQEYRQIVLNLVKYICGSSFDVKATGRTTIEINKRVVSKDVAIREILKGVSPIQKLVYIGDELSKGNDVPVKQLAETDPRVVCLEVKNPAETALFLMALQLK